MPEQLFTGPDNAHLSLAWDRLRIANTFNDNKELCISMHSSTCEMFIWLSRQETRQLMQHLAAVLWETMPSEEMKQ